MLNIRSLVRYPEDWINRNRQDGFSPSYKKNVKGAHLTYGVYDFIVMVEAETQDRLKETITYQIRALPSVKSTFTMVIVE